MICVEILFTILWLCLFFCYERAKRCPIVHNSHHKRGDKPFQANNPKSQLPNSVYQNYKIIEMNPGQVNEIVSIDSE